MIGNEVLLLYKQKVQECDATGDELFAKVDIKKNIHRNGCINTGLHR